MTGGFGVRFAPVWRASIPAWLIAAALAFPAVAGAAQPISPEPGARFTSDESVTFRAERSADEPDFAFVYSRDPDPAKGSFLFGPQADEGIVTERIELDFLASKFERFGRWYWSLCDVEYDDDGGYEPLLDQCSPPSSFTVAFRHPSLSSANARGYARQALADEFRGAYRSGYGHRVRCARQTKIRQSCRVSWVIGDGVYFGNVTIYRKRRFTYSAVNYRMTITLYDEYCHLVRKRPLAECQRRIRRSGQVG